MENIEVVKKRRTLVRRNFTKLLNEFEGLLKPKESVAEPCNIQLEAIFLHINQEYEVLITLNKNVEDCLFSDSNVSEADLNTEADGQADYKRKWFTIKAKFDSFTASSMKGSSKSSGEYDISKPKRNFYLPKLELHPFDGNVRNWIGFWGQFKKVHDDNGIEPEDKFQYLLQAMTQGSSARELVESFPPSAENYVKAIDQLKSRFARDEFLIEVYVRELLDLVLQQATKQNNVGLPLSSLYDKLETQLRALESLGVTSDKYAAMLYPLVESALPDEVLRAWERHRSSSRLCQDVSKTLDSTLTSNSTVNYLQMLLSFLRSEVESEERLALARTGFSSRNNKVTKSGNYQRKYKVESCDYQAENVIPTAATIFSSDSKEVSASTCLFCKKRGHNTHDCLGLQKLTLAERKSFVMDKGACFTCLKMGHMTKKCKVFVTCLFCKKRHYVLMCPELSNVKAQSTSKSEEVNSSKYRPTKASDKSESLTVGQNKETLMQTLLVKVRGLCDERKAPLVVRALLDTGSQNSYILKDCVDKLNLHKTSESLIVHSLFGGIEKQQPHNFYRVELMDINNTVSFPIEVLDQDKICNYVPRLQNDNYVALLRKKNIFLSDIGRDVPEIKLLLGADVLAKLFTGTVQQIDDSLLAVHTLLGWTIMGRCIGVGKGSMTSLNCFVKMDIPDLWRLEALGIKESYEVKSRNSIEEEAMSYFNDTVKLNGEGRYEVSLPWIDGRPELLSNRDLSEKRLLAVTKRLFSLGKFNDYNQVFSEWKEVGIIERVETQKSTSVHYLPHHAVIKESSLTTKIRPVFDASARDRNGNSLNSCLEKGPNLIELIPSLLVKFRKAAVGVVADIKKAFLQISLAEKDRDFMRFLWWDDYESRQLVEFRHCRVVFGVSSSPFLLAATLTHLLENSPNDMKVTADKLKGSFYVDNLVASVGNEEELSKFVNESQEILSPASFELRGWASNAILPESLTSSKDSLSFSNKDVVPVLGLLWDLHSDTLFCNVSCIDISTKPVTKRNLLSVSHRIFDPIGFTCPFTLLPKLLLQQTWKLKLQWDDEVPSQISQAFQKWIEDLCYLSACRIPRRYTQCDMHNFKSVSLHTFTDASKSAYATCIFLRIDDGEKVSVQLVEARSRLAPTKPITIPRLELMAALIGARLFTHVKSVLNIPECRYYFWTDSAVALAWIKTKGSWSTFVGNRCREICQATNPDDWNHVPSADNAADLPSRGCGGKLLIESKWWEGPHWLRKNEINWPSCDFSPPEEEVNQEKRKSVITAVSLEEPKFTDNFQKFNKYTKNVRIIGYILRFYKNLKGVKGLTGDLTTDELKAAEICLIKCVQQESLKEILGKVEVFSDQYGILRVKTKLTFATDLEDFKYPVLLPGKHHIVDKLIDETHRSKLHVGVQTLVTILRENYWILRCRNAVRKVLSCCVVCKRYRVKCFQTPSAPLPRERIHGNHAFETTGIDLAGPLHLKGGIKAYIVLFTCAVYRAIHLEIVTSLSTEAFLSAFRRFLARRGRVATVYTDNGTNFTGASNLLKKLDWTEIMKTTSGVNRITWKFNPPSAAWWGGWWERLVGMVKVLLRKNLGKSCISYEELSTVLCDCETVLNARPLTYLSTDDDCLQALTPAMFIQPTHISEVPDLDIIDATSINKRLRYLQRLRKALKDRFRKEYLALLVHKGKNYKEPEVVIGEVVLIGDDNVKRLKWPLGVIEELFPGKDGVKRVAKVRTSTGMITRPLQRIFPLEIRSKSEKEEIASVIAEKGAVKRKHDAGSSKDNQQFKVQENDESHSNQTTQSGRVIKPPQKLTLFASI